MILAELFLVFAKVGFCSFGAYSMIPVINDEMTAHGWMTVAEVGDILAIAEMTPGSVALNCASFVGMRTAGIAGSVVATLGVITPALTLCMLAAHFIRLFQSNKYVGMALYGVRPVCIAMILSAIASMGQAVFLESPVPWLNSIVIILAAGYLLIRCQWTIPRVVFLAAALGLFLC